MSPLAPLAILIFFYVAYALAQGEVWAKDRWSGKRVYRSESPFHYWFMIAVYTALGTLILSCR
jgi:hypothetical protein